MSDVFNDSKARFFKISVVTASLVSAAATLVFAAPAFAADPQTIGLSQDWRIQSSDQIDTNGFPAGLPGYEVSQPGFHDSSWYSGSVPSTVLGNLVQDCQGTSDPFYGTNLRSLLGTPIFQGVGDNQFTADTPANSPFAHPWWYRKVFTLPASAQGEHVDFKLDGATYGPQIWVNGHRVDAGADTNGSYRQFVFDITKYLNPPGQPNAIAVQVSNPKPHDLTPSWVDWNPTPQDKNMGLWRGASLSLHGPVALTNPQVVSKLDLKNNSAALKIEADVDNPGASATNGTVDADIGNGIHCSKPVSLAPHQHETVWITPQDCPALNVNHPRLWWPSGMGDPNLYHLDISFKSGASVSDRKSIDFGIREVTSSLTPQGSRQFFINGKPILIRGGAWASDMFLRFDPKNVAQQMDYARDMGLNTIRIEGDFQPDAFYDLADKKGILIMPGLTCCTAWQADSANWNSQQRAEADASMRGLILQLRAHPSVFTFLYGSDQAPSADIERVYRKAFSDLDWPDTLVASAASTDSPISGKSGFKMDGPYDYAPPSFWATKCGSGQGCFFTEVSPGDSIPTRDSLARFIPPHELATPPDLSKPSETGDDLCTATASSSWDFHAGQREFCTLQRHTDAIARRYGAIASTDDMIAKSQLMDYDNHRAMFEEFRRDKNRGATGVVQWMMNNAWPSLHWHLYDYYMNPGSAYFGVKEANRPLHVQFGYDNQEISLVNSTYAAHPGLHVTARIYDVDSRLIGTQQATLNATANGSQTVFRVNAPDSPKDGVYFVRLQLTDASGNVVDNNFYWVSKKPETYNPDPDNDWIGPNVRSEADFSALAKMPKVRLDTQASWNPATHTETIEVSNPSSSIALVNRFRLTSGPNQQDVLPAIWSDNDFTLAPGEHRTITIQATGAVNGTPEVHGEGWNALPW